MVVDGGDRIVPKVDIDDEVTTVILRHTGFAKNAGWSELGRHLSICCQQGAEHGFRQVWRGRIVGKSLYRDVGEFFFVPTNGRPRSFYLVTDFVEKLHPNSIACAIKLADHPKLQCR